VPPMHKAGGKQGAFVQDWPSAAAATQVPTLAAAPVTLRHDPNAAHKVGGDVVELHVAPAGTNVAWTHVCAPPSFLATQYKASAMSHPPPSQGAPSCSRLAQAPAHNSMEARSPGLLSHAPPAPLGSKQIERDSPVQGPPSPGQAVYAHTSPFPQWYAELHD
jgi:hypothetical protein